MRVTTEFTRGYQTWLMLKREILGVFICALVEFLVCVNAYSNDIFRNISGVLFSIVHFIIIYDCASMLGNRDTKPYSPLKYNVKWSVLWGVLISLISVLFMIMFNLNWQFGAVDGVFKNPVSMILNILFYIWESPYMAFLIMAPNVIPIGVAVLNVALPIVASVLGYISGKNNFAVSNFIHKIMFEKKDEEA